MIAAGIIMLVALSIVLLVCITDDRLLKNNKNIKSFKVKHIKTGNLYNIVTKEGKMKMNGEWKPSVIYIGKDKYTGKACCFVRERKDFEDNFEYINYKF